MSKIHLETEIKALPETVFDLARDVSLHTKSTVKTKEQAIAGVTTGMVEMGSTVTWRARHFGVWQELTVVVTHFDPPHEFADEMTKGAFKQMRHSHRFEPTETGTRMIDDFEFTAPLGILGTIADRLFLNAYMTKFLKARNEFLKAEAERMQKSQT
jgi:ligand-binding SRPBCC domain-containing protein